MRLLATALLLLAGCSSADALRNRNNPSGSPEALSNSVILSADVEARLRAMATDLAGTPYLEGGHSRDGMDAPALVQLLAAEVLGVDLPRNTARQLGIGSEILQKDLVFGDVVFFRPTNMPRHVGMYLGNQEFVHAWPESGVAVARLDDSYWNGAFWAGRRLITDGAAVPQAQQPVEEPETPRSRRRVGW